jgi:mannan endo-1,4-beta-mannosidase
MNKRGFQCLLVLAAAGSFSLIQCQDPHAGPVTPNASAEARALLDLYYSLSGSYTLTGQHNYPSTGDLNSRFAEEYSGKRPAIWSADMGFAEDGDKDSYLARPDIVEEAIRQHRQGSIVTICWHAVPPTADEPVTFQPRGPVHPDSLASVQGQLTDEQFREVLTPGTRLHERWAAQVDSVAFFLKQLEEAKVPVLWRPYHEMNGDWFWWGGRVGEIRTADLYRQLFDRYVHHHKLTNLVWVWNVDRPSLPVRKFSNFYPGTEYLDILSLDVYGSDFNQAYYDSLKVLSQGKPLLLGEVGNPPFPGVLDSQPDWTSWVIWAGMARNLTRKQYAALYRDPRILTRDDPVYWKLGAPFREACGLPVLPLPEKYPLDFTGDWYFDEEASELGDAGTVRVARRIKAYQDGDLLQLKRFNIVEWGDDQIRTEEILLDGQEMESRFGNSPRYSSVHWERDPASMTILSRTVFRREGSTREFASSEAWSLPGEGRLVIRQSYEDFSGQVQEITLEYRLIPFIQN